MDIITTKASPIGQITTANITLATKSIIKRNGRSILNRIVNTYRKQVEHDIGFGSRTIMGIYERLIGKQFLVSDME
jgi:hypothetical protein